MRTLRISKDQGHHSIRAVVSLSAKGPETAGHGASCSSSKGLTPKVDCERVAIKGICVLSGV